MKINQPLRHFSLLLMVLLPAHSYAFNVDKMIVVSDERGNGVVTLNNDEERTLFVEATINEVVIDKENNVVKTEYQSANIEDWKISLTHTKLVLKPGESKNVGVRSLCKSTTCDDSRDLMFMLSFVPSTYKPEQDATSSVEINYGFAPVYIIPTPKPKFDYLIQNNGDEVYIDNKSNTLINVFVDSCTQSGQLECKQRFAVVAGRKKHFRLPTNMQAETLSVTVTSHNRHYAKQLRVVRSKS